MSSKIGHSTKLLRHLVGFALSRKVYWIVPLVVILTLFALLGGTIQSAGTLVLYTLF